MQVFETSHRCLKCRVKYNKMWRKKNPHKIKQYNHKAIYGLTPEEYRQLYDAQEGRCAICGREGADGGHGNARSLCVDHNHRTRQVRGLLCAKCNLAIGYFDESVKRLLAAVQYLRQHRRLHEDEQARPTCRPTTRRP
jgi:hypothetical protein